MPHLRKGVKAGNDSVLRAFRESQNKEASSNTPPEWTSEIQEWTVDRDGALPLQFEGVQLSTAETSMEVRHRGKDQLQGTTVNLYVTLGGNLVTEVLQWRRTLNPELDGDDVYRQRAAHHATPEAALEWLYEDGGGKLGRCSKQAWLLACQKKNSGLENYSVERID
jgi:hypothetical protein